jgi:hypothetical protein
LHILALRDKAAIVSAVFFKAIAPGLETSMPKAIVFGSGVAGLSATIALALKGWSVEVHERSSTVREIGAGIFIKGNALRVLESFSLLDRIRRGFGRARRTSGVDCNPPLAADRRRCIRRWQPWLPGENDADR